MDSERRIARLFGALFILTFVTSIPAVFFYAPALSDPGYVLGPGADGSIAVGVLLEMVLIAANIGTAVVLVPLLRRTSEAGAVAYVAARMVESAFIGVGIVSMVALVMLRRFAATEGVDLDEASLLATARGLVAVHDASFLLGPAFMAPIGNGLVLGWLVLRSGLLPRRLAPLGFVGGALGLVTATAVLLGAWPQMSAIGLLLTLPEIVWELTLGFWPLFRGFRSPAERAADGASSEAPVGAVATAA